MLCPSLTSGDLISEERSLPERSFSHIPVPFSRTDSPEIPLNAVGWRYSKRGFHMHKKNKTVYAKLIADPEAGMVLKNASAMADAAKYLMDHGLNIHVALARPTKEATRAAKKAVKDGYDITIGGVIRGMVGAKARLGLITAGTENDFALSLGIAEGLKEACARIAAGKAWVDQGAPGGDPGERAGKRALAVAALEHLDARTSPSRLSAPTT